MSELHVIFASTVLTVVQHALAELILGVPVYTWK